MPNDTAASDLIGVMALIAVFVTAAAIVGVALLSSTMGDAAPAMLAHIETEGETISIYHDGGDPLEWGHFKILVDGVNRTGEFNLINATGEEYEIWTSWKAGEVLVNKTPLGAGSPRIQIVGEGVGRTGSDWLLHEIGDSTATVTTPTPVRPVAKFAANRTSGPAPLAVAFTDTSTGGATSWFWEFGDGGTSTLQNPSHTYAAAGTYTVTLTATNTGRSDTETKVGYVTVTELQPPAVTAITPDFGESGTIVSITNLTGTNFQNGATIKLTKSGETDIHATGVTFVSSTQITCSFNLAGAATGQWNIIVTNPDTQSGTLSNGFEVTTGQIYEPEPDLNDELTHWTTSGSINVITVPVYGDVVEITNGGSIKRTLPTIGYENIRVSFSLAAIGLNNPQDAIVVEWFDGTSWHELLRIKDNDPLENGQFHDFSYSLPSSAGDNPSFEIRFRIEHQGKTESALMDLKNLKVTGDPI